MTNSKSSPTTSKYLSSISLSSVAERVSNKTDRKEGIRNLENSNSKDQVERIQEIYETYPQYQERNRKAQQDD